MKDKEKRFLVIQTGYSNCAGYSKKGHLFQVRFFENQGYSSRPYFHLEAEIAYDECERKYFSFSSSKDIKLKMETWMVDSVEMRELDAQIQRFKPIYRKIDRLIKSGYAIKNFQDCIYLLKTVFHVNEFYRYDQSAENHVVEDTRNIEDEIRKLDEKWDEVHAVCFPIQESASQGA